MALTIPDICGWLEDPSVKSQRRYANWFNNFVGHRYRGGPDREQFLNGDDCYALRCAFLHQGSDDTEDQRARRALSKFFFVADPICSHNNRFRQALMINVGAFCTDISDGVLAWKKAVESNSEVKQRLDSMARIHERPFFIAPGVLVG